MYGNGPPFVYEHKIGMYVMRMAPQTIVSIESCWRMDVKVA